MIDFPELLSPSTVEMHSGLVLGQHLYSDHHDFHDRAVGTDHPRDVLETVIAERLSTSACVVQFSGGRDSAIVLAIASHVARRAGWDVPSALSVRYPHEPATDESQWQELITQHLGVRLEVLEVPRGGDELVSHLAVKQLVTHGPLMPPPSGVSVARIAPAVGNRQVLTGEGGDEILGESRVTPFVAHWRRRRRPSRGAIADMGRELLPRPARERLVRHHVRRSREGTWLRPGTEQAVQEALVRDIVDSDWDWRSARWRILQSRMWMLGVRDLDRVARHEGFELHHPLLDPRFVEAVCGQGGRWGLTTRTEAVRLLAGDLLPEPVLTRSTKAYFNEVYAGDGVRAFADAWDGEGLDGDLVLVEALRSAWRQRPIASIALAPLQLAVSAALDRGWEPGSA